MELSDNDKLTLLLNRLDFHTTEIQRRKEKDTKLFEWSTTLLLTVFAVIIALSDRSSPLQYQVLIKVIASLLIITPTIIFISRILGERKSMHWQAQVIERIESKFHLFEERYYVEGKMERESSREYAKTKDTHILRSCINTFGSRCYYNTLANFMKLTKFFNIHERID